MSNNTVIATPVTVKTVVTKASQAYSLFRQFKKEAKNAIPYKIGRSRAEYYSVAQMKDWYMSKGTPVDGGWFGRALNDAINKGMQISVSTITNSEGNRIRVYRASR